jgi:hypothetical protein
MFALIDPAGESSMGPRTWDQRLGAFTKGQQRSEPWMACFEADFRPAEVLGVFRR